MTEELSTLVRGRTEDRAIGTDCEILEEAAFGKLGDDLERSLWNLNHAFGIRVGRTPDHARGD